MANFTAKDVNELRKSTGAGLMDCKKALTEADGDTEKAIVFLREKGLATQAKKSGRVAAEGLVVAITNADNTVGAVVEVNVETDFAAGNPEFKQFVTDVANTIIEKNPADLDALNAEIISGGTLTVEATLQELFIKMRENMKIRRFERLEGILVPYVHGGGKIGAMVNMATDAGATEKVLEAGLGCALQVAAMNPPYLNKEAVPASAIEDERKILLAQMAEDASMANKPEQVRVKIVEGKLGKYYNENCLLEQDYFKENKLTVSAYLNNVAAEIGSPLTISQFVRYERGEGIEKKEDNFADEVASMMN